jgi:unspecific monooxygenase
MKLILASIYANYATRIIDDEGIEQADGYSTGPKGNKLILQLERVSSS